MSCVARRCSLFFVCRSSLVVSGRLSFVVLCSVVCVVACCCCCGCGLLLVIGVSACAVSIALVLSYLQVACGIKWSIFFLSPSSPSLFSHAPVCRFKTPPCVHSKRLHVCRQHAHMCFNMCAWCRFTRGRFARTHGDVLNVHTGFVRVSHHTPHRTHTTTQDTRHNNTPQSHDHITTPTHPQHSTPTHHTLKSYPFKDGERCVVCGCVILTFPVFSIITRHSDNFDFSKLPITLKIFPARQNNVNITNFYFSKIIWAIIL